MTQMAKETLQRWTSRQFIVTLVGMGLMFWATMAGKDVGPLSAVVMVAIGGAAGINWQERKQGASG